MPNDPATETSNPIEALEEAYRLAHAAYRKARFDPQASDETVQRLGRLLNGCRDALTAAIVAGLRNSTAQVTGATAALVAANQRIDEILKGLDRTTDIIDAVDQALGLAVGIVRLVTPAP
ncbi:MAG: hypothetical protein Q7V31_15645 [Parvibaculum sp.]|uniref:hypothetical protein n=1 Tax=Parvibaculum sp. TaxID=2024848 RepID=UPI0027196149|nr:hypothetical protein [Parvibaculum sp.]MDO8840346.1 hypothetical protein [Parvibaculum sp.]